MEYKNTLKRRREDENDHTLQEDEGPAEAEVEAEAGGEEGEEEEDEGNNGSSTTGLQGLLCITSLQTVLTMELCRDLTFTPPASQDAAFSDTSPLIPLALLNLIAVAAASLAACEDHQGCARGGGGRHRWKLARHGSEWARMSRGALHLDSAARDALFRRKYSMSYACFVYLVEELRPFIQSECSGRGNEGFFVRAPLEVERAVALVVFRLAHGLSSRQVADKYDVGASTVGKYTVIVTDALNKLYSRYVAIPTGERLARITAGFQRLTNLPNVCGAMDGIPLKLYLKPSRQQHYYYSSSCPPPPNSFHSVFLQAVCDSNGVFWHASCDGDGGLRRKIRDGVALREPVVAVGGVGVPVKPYMVARRGFYPMEPFCITPFGFEEGLRRAFDEQLLKGFSCIEEAFRILKTRWRILRFINVHSLDASHVALACCVLHNICQLWGEPDPAPDPPDLQDQSEGGCSGQPRSMPAMHRVTTDELSRVAGEEIREALYRDWVRRSLDESSQHQ